MSVLEIIQTPVNYEALGIKTILICTILALCSVIIYLYKSKETALKDKDARIMEVLKEHQTDLKDANNDMKLFIEKYHQFTQNIKDLVNGGKI